MLTRPVVGSLMLSSVGGWLLEAALGVTFVDGTTTEGPEGEDMEWNDVCVNENE